jgi:hypothetical protein
MGHMRYIDRITHRNRRRKYKKNMKQKNIKARKKYQEVGWE